ncbi:MAG TPA: phage portal protein, partial [Stellaceae bacterium]|nr:phage portal protein [Stellaceae bacterium]
MFSAFRTLFRGTERRSIGRLDDPLTLALLGGAPTAAGIAITAETALRSTAVFGAVRVLAETIAQLPLHLYRRAPDGGRERADDHPLHGLLTEAANPWMPAAEFRLVMQSFLSLHGNAFAYVGRQDGAIAELIALDPRTVAVECDSATMEPIYTVTDRAGMRRQYDRAEILHIRG